MLHHSIKYSNDTPWPKGALSQSQVRRRYSSFATNVEIKVNSLEVPSLCQRLSPGGHKDEQNRVPAFRKLSPEDRQAVCPRPSPAPPQLQVRF